MTIGHFFLLSLFKTSQVCKLVILLVKIISQKTLSACQKQYLQFTVGWSFVLLVAEKVNHVDLYFATNQLLGQIIKKFCQHSKCRFLVGTLYNLLDISNMYIISKSISNMGHKLCRDITSNFFVTQNCKIYDHPGPLITSVKEGFDCDHRVSPFDFVDIHCTTQYKQDGYLKCTAYDVC